MWEQIDEKINQESVNNLLFSKVKEQGQRHAQ